MASRFKLDSMLKILKKRNLEDGGKTQKEFTKEFAKQMDKYVPFDTGRMKDIDIEIGLDYVKYFAPYSKKQYYTNEGKGHKNKNGLRGKFWDKRCWNDNGTEILNKVAKKTGGKAKK